MDWEVELISLYLFVCKHYQAGLSSYCIRMSHYADLRFSDAGMHDRKAFEQILPALPENMLECYTDKAYQVEAEAIYQEQHVTLLTPVKKEKGQAFLDAADQWLSTAISRVRQPIESFFNWVNEKTSIQIASKVRSYPGLMVHVFGKLTPALFIMRQRVNPIA